MLHSSYHTLQNCKRRSQSAPRGHTQRFVTHVTNSNMPIIPVVCISITALDTAPNYTALHCTAQHTAPPPAHFYINTAPSTRTLPDSSRYDLNSPLSPSHYVPANSTHCPPPPPPPTCTLMRRSSTPCQCRRPRHPLHRLSN